MKCRISLSNHDLIKRFNPLNQVDRKYHAQLETHWQLKSFAAGEMIIRKSRDDAKCHFLIHGSVEIRQSFDERITIIGGSEAAASALEQYLAPRCTVRAIDECDLLIIDGGIVDQMLSWGNDYSLYYLDESGTSITNHTLIDDNFEEDWDSNFIQSALAANLSTQAIHQVFSCLESVDVRAGDVIVRKGGDADYFYIIKRGVADIRTEPDGPFKGKNFILTAGHYFGDEALVAHTVRNADVVMTTDGLLGRLSRETFDALIKSHLVNPLPSDGAMDGKLRRIDVRLPLEFRIQHDDDCENMPIHLLRKQLASLPSDVNYVLTPAGDCRSELATYLMRQAGLNAWYLPAMNNGSTPANATGKRN